VFGRLHPKHNFPYISLIVIGMISIACSFLSLGIVIEVLIATRIIVQFIGQIFAVTMLRRYKPGMEKPYRIWLYPIPNLIALIGWVFIFATSGAEIILFSLGALLLGIVCFLIWSWQGVRWPFQRKGGQVF
jgi:amino acid transporter